MSIQSIIDNVIAAEKGYVDHKSDRGGPTNWGITEAVARANGYTGDMRAMPQSFARAIYEKRYITEPKFDQVVSINPVIGEELIDTGVNMGPSRAAEFLQRWLNALNAQGSRYPDMFVDGRLGPVSLDALRKFLAWRGKDGEKVLFRALNGLQATRYLEIAEGNKTQEDFLFGWLLNRVS
jgi:lysozyme family protein